MKRLFKILLILALIAFPVSLVNAENGYIQNHYAGTDNLTPSLPVFTDSDRNLVSKSIADTLTALGLTNAVVYKGAIDCSGNPNFPAADAGDAYIVSVDGKIGGASGINVITGDTIICKTDGTIAGTQAAVGANWNIIEQNIDLSNIIITGGNITGLANLGASNATLTGGTITGITDLAVADGGTGASTLTDHGVLVGSGTSAITPLAVGTTGQVLIGATDADPAFGTLTVGYVSGAAATADLAEDLSTASHYLYKNSGGNITDATVGIGLSDSTGNLSVKQVVNTVFADTDAAVTVAASKKGYVVPSLYNGSTVSSMTCAVYDTNSANANATTINLTKASGGVLTNVFDTAANIPFGSYSNTTSVYNATNAVVVTGDLLIANVTAIADPAPLGLSCTFIFAH